MSYLLCNLPRNLLIWSHLHWRNIRNASIRWSEHNNINGTSEPTKHIAANTTPAFSWKVISVAPKNAHKCKLLEAMIIRLLNTSLNEQLETKSLILFRSGVT